MTTRSGQERRPPRSPLKRRKSYLTKDEDFFKARPGPQQVPRTHDKYEIVELVDRGALPRIHNLPPAAVQTGLFEAIYIFFLVAMVVCTFTYVSFDHTGHADRAVDNTVDNTVDYFRKFGLLGLLRRAMAM